MPHAEPVTSILQGHVMETLLRVPAQSVHCCVTSPPYYMVRDYQTPPVEWPDGWVGQLGLEPTPDQYVSHLVDVFREVREVLRDDGTLWLNLGDSYAGGNKGSGGKTAKQLTNSGSFFESPSIEWGKSGLKPKDLIGIPWRVAFALQADGWYLRDAIVWHKPNPMPSSVTDRCTSSYEMFFMLSTRQSYYFDAYAIREPISEASKAHYKYGFGGAKSETIKSSDNPTYVVGDRECSGYRNKRNVWTLSTESSRIKHYAMMPTKLIEPAIKAGTSEHGACSSCGAPYARELSKTRRATRPGTDTKIEGMDDAMVGNCDPQRHVTETRTVGWSCPCKCVGSGLTPCVVLDPFAGAGTVGLVARRLGRSFIGCELKDEYVDIAKTRAGVPNAQ